MVRTRPLDVAASGEHAGVLRLAIVAWKEEGRTMLLRPLAHHVLQTHAKLEHSEQRHRQLFEGNPGPILVYDLDTLEILDVNPAARRL